jgi:hypothetical protein
MLMPCLQSGAKAVLHTSCLPGMMSPSQPVCQDPGSSPGQLSQQRRGHRRRNHRVPRFPARLRYLPRKSALHTPKEPRQSHTCSKLTYHSTCIHVTALQNNYVITAKDQKAAEYPRGFTLHPVHVRPRQTALIHRRDRYASLRDP